MWGSENPYAPRLPSANRDVRSTDDNVRHVLWIQFPKTLQTRLAAAPIGVSITVLDPQGVNPLNSPLSSHLLETMGRLFR